MRRIPTRLAVEGLCRDFGKGILSLNEEVHASIAKAISEALGQAYPDRNYGSEMFMGLARKVLSEANELIASDGRREWWQAAGLIVGEGCFWATWRGRPLQLTRSEIRILLELICFDLTSQDELIALLKTNSPSLRVRISKLRHGLPPEIQIQATYGQGYRLQINGDSPTP